MRVGNQFRNTGGTFSQTFPQNPSAAQIYIETSNITYHVAQPPLPRNTPPPVKQPPIAEHTFVMNTMTSMKNGQQRAIKRAPANPVPSEASSVNSDHTSRQLAKPPRLRPSKPLQNSGDVYPDIWFGILSFTEPKFLLEARTICKEFYKLLEDHSAIWRSSRMKFYGSDMPECPDGQTETQYVDLLAGRGCQISKCAKTETQKVHWIYRGRLCTDCLAEKTMRVRCYFATPTCFEKV